MGSAKLVVEESWQMDSPAQLRIQARRPVQPKFVALNQPVSDYVPSGRTFAGAPDNDDEVAAIGQLLGLSGPRSVSLLALLRRPTP